MWIIEIMIVLVDMLDFVRGNFINKVIYKNFRLKILISMNF